MVCAAEFCRRPKPYWKAFAVLTAVLCFAMFGSSSRSRADDSGARAEAAKLSDERESADRGAPAASFRRHVDDLIKQLGSPQYTVRRAAASELEKIGFEAFDQLHAATDHADPEIASSAQYLLRQITVRWSRSGDSLSVRRLLRNYGEQEENDRRGVILVLAELPQREGLAGLCRIARFDRSLLLSRLAAVAIIRSRDDDADSRPADPEAIERELGSSTRVASAWLRQYQLQLRDPVASVAGWRELIDEESRRVDAADEATSSAIVAELLWNLAEVHRRLGEAGPLVDTTDRIITTSSADPERVIAVIVQWLTKHESWDALEEFTARYDERIRQTKLASYLLAVAHSERGQSEAAEQLAEQASRLAARQPLENIEAARILTGLGHFEWAVREHRVVVDNEPLESPQSIGARVSLADLLKDHEQYQEAAEAMAPLVDAIGKNPDLQRAYKTARVILGRSEQLELDLPMAESLAPLQHFLWACHFEQQGDFEQQREHLLQSLQNTAEDTDVLIAMYRLKGADDQWRAETLQRIDTLSRKIEEQIENSPDNYLLYNQWAWLVANTEGDYRKAVRYSRRSLELRPGVAGFLDTLGRCYYAAGDYENAVKYQREAVRLIPHMQVMRRQLKLFEDALAGRQRREVGGRGSDKNG